MKSMLSNRSKSNHSNEQDCEQKLQCAACLVAFDKKYWSKAERDNYERDRRTLLVCKSCRDSRGYTPDDVKTYTCEQCQDKGGFKLFDKELMHNMKSHGTKKLLCVLCVKQVKMKSRAATEIQKQQKVLQVLLSDTPPILSTKSLLFQRATLARQRRLYYRSRKRFSGEIRPNTWLVAESLGTATVDIVASCHSCRRTQDLDESLNYPDLQWELKIEHLHAPNPLPQM